MRDMAMELLAPAGDREALVAAVQNGADAVYFGAAGFNARRGAANFAGEALREAVAYCHLRGVRVHVTLNTLVRRDELAALEETIRAIDDAKADAVIVQDLGVAAAVKKLAPALELHGSTQLAVHNRQGVEYLADHGFARAVLAREMEYDEIAACRGRGVALECFIHGALCVSCSGQCLFSSLVGGRSGNRGMCAQPCRLPYRLGAREGYLLSPRDLMLLGELDRLRDAGADSLKIEGRLKRAEYVAVTTAAYRRALDALDRGESYAPTKEEIEALRQMFNRGGFTRGYAGGLRDEELMYPERPNHLGVSVGRCAKPGQLILERDVETADALALRREGAEDRPVKLAGRRGEKVPCKGAQPGDALIRLVEEAQLQAARETYRGENRRIPVQARLTLRVGEKAVLFLQSAAASARIESAEAVEQAQNRPFDSERARVQLEKTGGTPYRMQEIEIDADEAAFFPVSQLNALRREALEALGAAILEEKEGGRPAGAAALDIPEFPEEKPERVALLAQSGDVKALLRAKKAGADALVFAPEDLRRPALDAALAALGEETFYLALPPVLRAETLDELHAWAWLNAGRIAGVYVSNVGQLGLDWPGEKRADSMLNILNPLTLGELARSGIAGYAPSIELNCGQIAEVGGPRELVVYGRIPLMQLRHCPLRAGDKQARGLHADCRRCDRKKPGERLNDQALVDRKGVAFPLRRIAAETGCVIQVLNSVPLMLLRRAERLPRAAAWRLLLTNEDPIEALLRCHRAAADAGANAREVCRSEDWAELENRPSTTGHYFRGVE